VATFMVDDPPQVLLTYLFDTAVPFPPKIVPEEQKSML
jgi:hypothetical protein